MSAPSNRYEGRWRWWYTSIADRMIAHPDWTQNEIARDLGRGANTISMIVNTDLFKDYFARRKEEFRIAHDTKIANNLTRVAEASLDILLSQLDKKKDIVPIQVVQSIAEGALDRLGYAPKAGPSVQVNVQNNTTNQTVVRPNVSLTQLEEARAAMRAVEQQRALTPPRVVEVAPSRSAIESEEEDAPLTISSQ